ncbi:MAG TPA: glycosyl transferase [Hyphomicrobiales bacterium]|nr:glycosyl transferase [Hyphomicrobiales bacterium]
MLQAGRDGGLRHSLAVALLILATLAATLPGFFRVPPVDRDEPRFAEATRQMLASGNFVDIRFQDEPRYNKPVGIYWLQAAAVAAGEGLGVPDARQAIWLYRLPSLLGVLAAVLLTYWAGLPLVGGRGALLGGLALATAILVGVEARLATTDAVLLATVVAMQGALARIYPRGRGWRQPVMPGLGPGIHEFAAPPPQEAADGRDRPGDDGGGVLGLALLFWVALALGVLVKGPITPMIAALTIAALVAVDRRAAWLKHLRPAIGLPLAILIVAPWLVAIGLASHGKFFSASLGTDMLAKVGGARESHGAPPLTYLAAVWGLFWPASALVPLAIVPTWRARAEPGVRFLLAWLVPAWIVFELVPTKLPHYVLPLLPALALLFGRWLADTAERVPPLWARLAAAALLGLGAAVLPLALFGAIARMDGYWSYRMVPFVLVAWALLGLALAKLWRGRLRTAFALTLAVAVATYGGVYQIGLPELRSLWISPRLAAAVATVPCTDPAVATAGDNEPSLVFLTRPDLLMTDGAGAARFLAGGGCRIAFVERRQEAAFRTALAAGGTRPALATTVSGVNLNGGHRLDIGVFAVYPKPP